MFTAKQNYILVSNNSLIIKNGKVTEYMIDIYSLIPYIPFYYHLFDTENDVIKDITKQTKKLKIRNAFIIMPDDTMELYTDRKTIQEFFILCGANKLIEEFQCFYLSNESNRYISISKSVRAFAFIVITNNKKIYEKYYHVSEINRDEIKADIQRMKNEYGDIPVYINNINQELDSFQDIGYLVSRDKILTNISSKTRYS